MSMLETILTILASLLSAGGLSWIITAKQDKRAKELENVRTQNQIEEEKKDNAVDDFKDLVRERKERMQELKETIGQLSGLLEEKNKECDELKEALHTTKVACVRAELLKCTVVPCPQRIPPLGLTENKLDITE